MVKRLFLLMSALLLAVGLIACDADANTRDDIVSPSGDEGQPLPDATQSAVVDDPHGLTQLLQAAGAEVIPNGGAEQSFFSAPGTLHLVNGAEVQVYEYETAEQAEAEANQISPDGTQIGDNPVRWEAPPHFYQSGRMIVLYLGDDPETLALLEDVVGPQFAGQ